VGFFVTALNLLPAGQFDGGHIARALLGEKARYVSYVVVAILFMFSFFYVGWAIIAILLIFIGLRHPPPLNDFTTLDVKRKLVGGFTVLVFLMTFVLVPMQEIPAEYDFEFRDFVDQTQEIVRADVNMSEISCSAVPTGTNCTYEFVVNNTGNKHLNLTLSATVSWDKMRAWMTLPDFPEIAANSTINFVLNATVNTTVSLVLFFPDEPYSGAWLTQVTVTVEGLPVQIEKNLEIWVDTDA